jgi:hypothetical protein
MASPRKATAGGEEGRAAVAAAEAMRGGEQRAAALRLEARLQG